MYFIYNILCIQDLSEKKPGPSQVFKSLSLLVIKFLNKEITEKKLNNLFKCNFHFLG